MKTDEAPSPFVDEQIIGMSKEQAPEWRRQTGAGQRAEAMLLPDHINAPEPRFSLREDQRSRCVRRLAILAETSLSGRCCVGSPRMQKAAWELNSESRVDMTAWSLGLLHLCWGEISSETRVEVFQYRQLDSEESP